MSRQRPLIFSSDGVRGILAGTKTQTRRVLKPQPSVTCIYTPGSQPAFVLNNKRSVYGDVGDRPWVRETWREFRTPSGNVGVAYQASYTPGGFNVVEDDVVTTIEIDKWSSARFMSHKQSRLDLEILQVRIQRLQEITEEDAKAEGVDPMPRELDSWHDGTYRTAFELDWHRGHSPHQWDSWAANPWVTVLTFRALPPKKKGRKKKVLTRGSNVFG